MSSNLDADQIIQTVYNAETGGLTVTPAGGTLVSEEFDYVDITNSEIGGQTVPTQVVYKMGGSGGTTVATLTLTYDVNANLETISKS